MVLIYFTQTLFLLSFSLFGSCHCWLNVLGLVLFKPEKMVRKMLYHDWGLLCYRWPEKPLEE